MMKPEQPMTAEVKLKQFYYILRDADGRKITPRPESIYANDLGHALQRLASQVDGYDTEVFEIQVWEPRRD